MIAKCWKVSYSKTITESDGEVIVMAEDAERAEELARQVAETGGADFEEGECLYHHECSEVECEEADIECVEECQDEVEKA